ncbi:MAG: DMT family transporter [Planctomycetota bacterium]
MREPGTSYVPHLLMTALIATWAGSFVVAKFAMQWMTPFAVVASRFLLGCLCILPFFLRSTERQREGTLGPGILAGLVLAIPYFLQMYGVRETTASMGGFVTGLIVLLVAVGGALFFGARIGRATIVGLMLGLTGIVTLCLTGDVDPDGVQTNTLRGILLQVGSAVGFAAHILLLSHYGSKLATAPFAFWQLAFTGALATLGTIFVSGIAVEGEPFAWSLGLLLALGYLGVLATGVAIGVQAWVQPKIKPTHVALLFALQPLFGAIAGWLFRDEHLGPAQWLGGGLIVTAVVITARERS